MPSPPTIWRRLPSARGFRPKLGGREIPLGLFPADFLGPNWYGTPSRAPDTASAITPFTRSPNSAQGPVSKAMRRKFPLAGLQRKQEFVVIWPVGGGQSGDFPMLPPMTSNGRPGVEIPGHAGEAICCKDILSVRRRRSGNALADPGVVRWERPLAVWRFCPIGRAYSGGRAGIGGWHSTGRQPLAVSPLVAGTAAWLTGGALWARLWRPAFAAPAPNLTSLHHRRPPRKRPLTGPH